MNLKHLKAGVRKAVFLAAVMLSPGGASGAPLVYEGFDYTTPGSLAGRIGGYGWNGAWQIVNNGSADLVANSLVAGANSPTGFDSRSFGNSVTLPNNRRIGRSIDISPAGYFGSRGYRDSLGRIGADGKTIYISFIQQPNGTSAYYEFEFHRGSLGDPGRIAGIGNDQGGDNVNLRAPDSTHTLIGPGNTGVNFYVVRIDFKAGNDNVYVYRNPTSLTEPPVPTLTRLAAADMSFDGVAFGAFNNSRTVAHDEVRLGETWEDVVVPASAVPAVATQPSATNAGFVTGSVTLSAQITGYPLPTYQWFKGNAPLAGQISTSLTLSNLQVADGGAYHLTATNSVGSVSTADAQVAVQTAPPGLLAYEGFDYGQAVGSLPGKSGGIGWASAWTNVNGGGGAISAGSLIAGTNGPNGYDTRSSGNAVMMPNGQRDGRLVDTSTSGRFGAAGYLDTNGNIGADGKTIYLSFLQQPDGTSKFYEFEFHRGNLGDPGRIGGIGNDTSNPTISLRTGGTQNIIGPASTGVNLYVVRIDFKAGDDDVYVYQNPISAAEPGVPTLVRLAASDMSFNGLSLAAFDNGRTAKHDEIRVGQSWADVVFGTSRNQLTWLGNSTTNIWDFSAPNWTSGAGPIPFVNGDPVTFDDTGSAAPAISVPGAVSTASMTSLNETKNYTLSGAGLISSSGGLIKSGGGGLVLNAPANFGAAVLMNAGDLSLNGTTTVSGEISVKADAGTLTLGGTNTVAGSLIADGGAQIFSGNNTFAGIETTSSEITISGPTTFNGGGSHLWFGNLPGSSTQVTISNGGSLTMTGAYSDSWVIGRDGGSTTFTQTGGTVTYNPSNRDVMFVGASASGLTSSEYNLSGGLLEMSTKRLGVALGPITAHFNQSGGVVNALRLELGSILTTGTGIYNLTGGSLNIGSGGIITASGTYQMNLGNGTLGAAADWASTMVLTLNGTGLGTTFATGEYRMTLNGPLFGEGGLNKTGTGTLVLGGSSNGYSGNTVVTAGTIAGTGCEVSNFSIASGATVSPGDAGLGIFYLAGGTFASGSKLNIDIDNVNQFSDQLVTYGNLTITGTQLALGSLGSGIVPAGTKLTIVDYTGSALTGTFAGLAQGASVTVGPNSYTLNYSDAGQITLTSTTVAGPYDIWLADNGLDGSPGKEAGFNADPDQDGIANGIEWILGGNPLTQGESLVAVAGTTTDGLTLTFSREEGSIGIANLFVEWSTSLGSWNDVPVLQAGGIYPNGITVTVNEAATPDTVTVHIPAANAGNGRLFGRLRAIKP